MKKFREILGSGERGFTLIELLVVIAVLGILAGIAVPRLGGVTDKAELTEAVSAIGSIKTAMEMARTEYGKYPGDGDITVDKNGEVTGRIGEYIDSLPSSDNWTYTINAKNDGDTVKGKFALKDENNSESGEAEGKYSILVQGTENKGKNLAAEFVEGNGKVQTTTKYDE